MLGNKQIRETATNNVESNTFSKKNIKKFTKNQQLKFLTFYDEKPANYLMTPRDASILAQRIKHFKSGGILKSEKIAFMNFYNFIKKSKRTERINEYSSLYYDIKNGNVKVRERKGNEISLDECSEMDDSFMDIYFENEKIISNIQKSKYLQPTLKEVIGETINNRNSTNRKRKEKQINIDLSGANNAKNTNTKKLCTEKIFEEINQIEQKPEPNYNKKKEIKEERNLIPKNTNSKNNNTAKNEKIKDNQKEINNDTIKINSKEEEDDSTKTKSKISIEKEKNCLCKNLEGKSQVINFDKLNKKDEKDSKQNDLEDIIYDLNGEKFDINIAKKYIEQKKEKELLQLVFPKYNRQKFIEKYGNLDFKIWRKLYVKCDYCEKIIYLHNYTISEHLFKFHFKITKEKQLLDDIQQKKIIENIIINKYRKYQKFKYDIIYLSKYYENLSGKTYGKATKFTQEIINELDKISEIKKMTLENSAFTLEKRMPKMIAVRNTTKKNKNNIKKEK